MNKEQTNTEKVNKPVFTRKGRIGINPFTIPEMGSRFVQINSDKIEKFERKNDEPIDFVMATDLETGEEGHLWLSGQLVYNFTELAKKNALKNAKLEIVHKGQKPMEIDGEKVKVNQYDIFELN